MEVLLKHPAREKLLVVVMTLQFSMTVAHQCACFCLALVILLFLLVLVLLAVVFVVLTVAQLSIVRIRTPGQEKIVALITVNLLPDDQLPVG